MILMVSVLIQFLSIVGIKEISFSAGTDLPEMELRITKSSVQHPYYPLEMLINTSLVSKFTHF